MKSVHNSDPRHGDRSSSKSTHNCLRQRVKPEINPRPHHGGGNANQQQEQRMSTTLKKGFLHKYELTNGEIRTKLGVGRRHAVISKRCTQWSRLPECILQHFVHCLVDQESSNHKSKGPRSRRQSISNEKNTTKIRKECKQGGDGASRVIGRVEGHKCKVKMGKPTILFSELKTLGRITIAASGHVQSRTNNATIEKDVSKRATVDVRVTHVRVTPPANTHIANTC